MKSSKKNLVFFKITFYFNLTPNSPYFILNYWLVIVTVY